jgi:hypothetical protein
VRSVRDDAGCKPIAIRDWRFTCMVRVGGAFDRVAVSADGKGMVPLAGAGLLALCAERVGLARALSGALAPMRRRRGRHDPGRVIGDLVVMLACGGDSVADMVVLGGQERLFGGVASQATARRAIAWLAEDPERLERLRAARARATARAWELAPGLMRSSSRSTRR